MSLKVSALRNNTWSKDTLHRWYRQMVNQTVTNWDAYRGLRCSEVCLFPFCSDWRPRWLICAVFLPFPSSALIGFKDLGLVLDDQWINKLFSKDKLIASLFRETAASVTTHMWTVKVLCLTGFSMYIWWLSRKSKQWLCAFASLWTWCWDAIILKVCAYIDLFVLILDALFVVGQYSHLFLSWPFLLFFAHFCLRLSFG